mgnify:CR=1 FL=1
MAEETTDQETVEEEVEETAPVVPGVYVLKSVVRGRGNRAARMVAPGRQPFVQKLAGGSITVRRARPARITEAALIRHLAEIKKAVAAHQLVVTTTAGAVVDLDTFEVAPLVPAPPLPNPPLDSAKNDKNQNVGYDVPPTPEGTTMSAPTPELLKTGPLHADEVEAEPDTVPGLLSHVSMEATPEPAEEEFAEVDPEPESDALTDEPAPATPSAAPEASGKKHQKHKRGR